MSGEAVFEGIPRGIYAVSVFHDENMNGKLDKNHLGAPKEGYGTSNNTQQRMGCSVHLYLPPECMESPAFGEAKFSVDESHHSVEIKLMY